MNIDLPWPPLDLQPNARSHGVWRARQTAAKRYKATCAILCRAEGLRKVGVEKAHLSLQFCPPDKRRRDLDNMLASFKYGVDAISEAIGLDDYHFGFTITRGEPVKHGIVRVTITEDAV